jgi:aryl carrier-like protein
MAGVFVSYNREDSAKVRKLVAALRDDGIDVWWDEDIAPSSPTLAAWRLTGSGAAHRSSAG